MDRDDLKFFIVVSVCVVSLAIWLAWIATRPGSPSLTIEGTVLDVEIGSDLKVMWENDDGIFALIFDDHYSPIPVGEPVRLTYEIDSRGNQYIKNIEVLIPASRGVR